ncbi:class I SAM-dependent methyltransferase [Rhodoblastus sp.]|uniref:class I SAM-dependent methyltransferase n=1 Tax=Rhodoblastus sp. TaxID=1962975 RepID=UPI003F98ED58
MSFSKSDYKEFPKALARDDLWGQVRRTVHGKPVSDEQIAMIVDAIRQGLQLQPTDAVLDLACGNGALASAFFAECAALHGVDSSEYLIEIANERFAIPGKTSFEVDDAAHYVANAPDAGRFTKVLCYGSFTYFSETDAAGVLDGLARRFFNVRRVMIGNLPDADRAHLFYPEGKGYAGELKDPKAQIGVWRSEAELRDLASDCGWKLEIMTMPPDFYAAHYRFDAILTR